MKKILQVDIYWSPLSPNLFTHIYQICWWLVRIFKRLQTGWGHEDGNIRTPACRHRHTHGHILQKMLNYLEWMFCPLIHIFIPHISTGCAGSLCSFSYVHKSEKKITCCQGEVWVCSQLFCWSYSHGIYNSCFMTKVIGKCAFGDSTLNDNELLNVKEVKRGATFTSLIFYWTLTKFQILVKRYNIISLVEVNQAIWAWLFF